MPEGKDQTASNPENQNDFSSLAPPPFMGIEVNTPSNTMLCFYICTLT